MINIKRITKDDSKRFDREWKQFDKSLDIRWSEKDYHFGVFLDKKLIGYIEININGGVGYLHEIFVRKKYRGKRIGEILMKKFEDFCKSKGCHKLTLKTSERHKVALSLYKKFGYKVETILKDDCYNLKWFLFFKKIK